MLAFSYINRHDASLVDARDDAIWDETASSPAAYLESLYVKCRTQVRMANLEPSG